MASAKAYIICDILHGDGIGVIGGDKLNALLHIGVGGVLCFLPVGALNEKGKGRIQASGHFHCVLKLIASGIVDMKNLAFDIISIWDILDDGVIV